MDLHSTKVRFVSTSMSAQQTQMFVTKTPNAITIWADIAAVVAMDILAMVSIANQKTKKNIPRSKARQRLIRHLVFQH